MQKLLEQGIEFFAGGPKLTAQDIKKIELMIEAPLPDQYRNYLLHANGGTLDKHMCKGFDDGYCSKVYWPKGNNIFPDEEYRMLNNFLEYNENPKYESETLYYNFMTWKEYLPQETLPIGRGPGGNYFLIGYGKKNVGKIYYWCIVSVNIMEHDDDTCAIAYDGFIADSFVEFIQTMVPCNMIDW